MTIEGPIPGKIGASGLSTEQGERIVYKKSQELTDQLYEVRSFMASYDLFNLHHRETWVARPDQQAMEKLYEVLGKLIHDVVRCHDSISINNAIDLYTKQQPGLLKVYAGVLHELRQKEEDKIRKMFEKAIARLAPSFDKKERPEPPVIRLDDDLTLEQGTLLKKSFPTGNFLLHFSDVPNSIKILESGSVLANAEVEEKEGKEWGHGGKSGISFNMNNVRVLTGTNRHFIGFLVAPETVLNDKYRLVVPPSAAEFEVQLMGATYKRPETAEEFEKFYENKDKMPKELLPRVDLKNTFIFCRESDALMIKELLARLGQQVKGLLTFPDTKLRVESWSTPTGDHVLASQLVRSTFSRADINPTIDWRHDLFKNEPQIIDNYAVRDEDVGQSYSIIKTDHGLEVVHE